MSNNYERQITHREHAQGFIERIRCLCDELETYLSEEKESFENGSTGTENTSTS
jgi:hypothetical protein